MSYHLRDLRDQVIVITGATSGIGLATAYEAAAQGARVVLTARNGTALAAVVNQIRNNGGKAVAVVADVSRSTDLENVADTAIKTYGGFDTWVNNAGIGIFGRLDEVSDDDSRRLFDVNFWGLVYGTRIAAAHLKQKGGAIINLGSVVSDLSFPMQGMYCASKHAIKGFTDAFRMELEEEGAPISITLIKPAAINTPFASHAKNYMRQEPKLPPPLYRPEDVAAAIIHAAQHGGRDYYIGGAGKLMSTFNKHLPSVFDWVAARAATPMSSTGQPPRRARAGNLFAAGRDGDVHGDTPHHVMRSAYTQATLRPALSSTVLAALAIGAAALASRRKA